MSDPHAKKPPLRLPGPLPANAIIDAELMTRIDELCAQLPDSLARLNEALEAVRPFAEYDAAAARAALHVRRAAGSFSTAEPIRGLVKFAREHMPVAAAARVIRRLLKSGSATVRRAALSAFTRTPINEVALPLGRFAEGEWNASGWTAGLLPRPLSRHRHGSRVQQRNGVPPLANVGDIRKLLGICSPAQLGWLLTATDKPRRPGSAPYRRFAIPKRDGRERIILAPCDLLMRVQRAILDKILAGVPPHACAHGFVVGRSIVSNAAPHSGAALILKFDLTDFFPTIDYFRVLGLFASLGYSPGSERFATADIHRAVAPTLARLCCHTPSPERLDDARLPQGSPTSPAISNLICRRMDSRLDGLARRCDGVYTRYADDLTFSFRDDAVDVGRFRWWVDQICHQEGFLVNQAKFRAVRRSQRQMVTGIVVNDVLRVPREERRRFRAVLHACRLHGVASQARGRPRFPDWLRGFAAYIRMVHPQEGVGLVEEVERLLGTSSAPDGGQP